MSYLSAKNMVAGYGTTTILKDCSIEVDKGKLAVVVGPNGAGKSSAMKAILGMLKLTSGVVTLDGVNINKLSVQKRISLGMAFVPQNNNVFPTMSVLENLEIGAILRSDNIKITNTIDEIYQLFPILYKKRRQMVGQLSGGQRQQVAFGRALMTKPLVMLLDEPTAGVSPIIMDEIFANILQLKSNGIAVLMVEQNAKQALEIADVGFVLVDGSNKRTASGKELLANPEVRRSFLGG